MPSKLPRNSTRSINFQAGFTLIELMIVIVVGAILTSIAAPAFNSYINSTRQTSAIIQLVGDLNRARGEAIKRNSRVIVCARNSTDDDCQATPNWQNGWLVCFDVDNDSVCDTATVNNPNPIVLRPPQSDNVALTSSNLVLRFNPNGTQGAGALPATVTVLGNWSGATARVITVASTGNISK
jgi:type IV fimbrial biogenesis protein FimT